MDGELPDHGAFQLVVLKCRYIALLGNLCFLRLSFLCLEVCQDQLLVWHRSCVCSYKFIKVICRLLLR